MKLKVLFCVSGSIAAYKAADAVSALTHEGHEVQCLLTEGAKQFVTPLVLETLSQRPVQDALWGPGISGTEHIRLARWPDVVVFAPATAHLLAKLALGLADDLVTTVALATRAPWLIAPAMNTAMWEQPIVQEHCATLRRRGARFVEPQGSGVLACGEEGAGKLARVEDLLEAIRNTPGPAPQAASSMRGQTILITAGPTTSAIDAVRYLTNPSTGKMGAALAEEALRRGARVIHVLGVDKGVVRPQAPAGASDRLELIEVETAEQMLQAALAKLPQATGVAATAAVLDYRVEAPRTSKEKRGTDARALQLVPSADVLQGLRQAARPEQWFLGFAAETDDLDRHAREKLQRKNLDFLFANRVPRRGETLDTGFGTATNAGVLYRRGGTSVEFPLDAKPTLAGKLWDSLGLELGWTKGPSA